MPLRFFCFRCRGAELWRGGVGGARSARLNKFGSGLQIVRVRRSAIFHYAFRQIVGTPIEWDPTFGSPTVGPTTKTGEEKA